MTEQVEADGIFRLPERMDMAAAVALRDLVLTHPRDLILDARDVTFVTTPALQVLMAARDHQDINEKDLQIVDVSSGFTDAIRMLGVPLSRLQTSGVDT